MHKVSCVCHSGNSGQAGEGKQSNIEVVETHKHARFSIIQLTYDGYFAATKDLFVQGVAIDEWHWAAGKASSLDPHKDG
jgi:hypothetical protein